MVNTNLLLNVIGSLQAWQLFLVLTGYKAGTQVLGLFGFAEGFGQTTGSVSSSFRQGYAAAASMVLFTLVLVIGLTVQYILNRREQRLGGTRMDALTTSEDLYKPVELSDKTQ